MVAISQDLGIWVRTLGTGAIALDVDTALGFKEDEFLVQEFLDRVLAPKLLILLVTAWDLAGIRFWWRRQGRWAC